MRIAIGITGTSGALLSNRAIELLYEKHDLCVMATENGSRAFFLESGCRLYDFLRRKPGVVKPDNSDVCGSNLRKKLRLCLGDNSAEVTALLDTGNRKNSDRKCRFVFRSAGIAYDTKAAAYRLCKLPYARRNNSRKSRRSGVTRGHCMYAAANLRRYRYKIS